MLELHGYSSLLLRCEGEIRLIQTSPFLVATSLTSSVRTFGAVVGNTGSLLGLGVKDAIGSLACPILADEVGHTRLCHELVNISDKATSEKCSRMAWLGSYTVNLTHQGACVQAHTGWHFRGSFHDYRPRKLAPHENYLPYSIRAVAMHVCMLLKGLTWDYHCWFFWREKYTSEILGGGGINLGGGKTQ